LEKYDKIAALVESRAAAAGGKLAASGLAGVATAVNSPRVAASPRSIFK
jgi:hypothetical protein